MSYNTRKSSAAAKRETQRRKRVRQMKRGGF